MQRLMGKKTVDAETIGKRMQYVLDAYKENDSQLLPMASTSSVVPGYVSYSTKCGLEGHNDILNYAARKCDMEMASSDDKPKTVDSQNNILSRLRPKRAIKRSSEPKTLTSTRKQRKSNKRSKKEKALIEDGTEIISEHGFSTNNDEKKVENVANVVTSGNFNDCA